MAATGPKCLAAATLQGTEHTWISDLALLQKLPLCLPRGAKAKAPLESYRITGRALQTMLAALLDGPKASTLARDLSKISSSLRPLEGANLPSRRETTGENG